MRVRCASHNCQMCCFAPITPVSVSKYTLLELLATLPDTAPRNGTPQCPHRPQPPPASPGRPGMTAVRLRGCSRRTAQSARSWLGCSALQETPPCWLVLLLLLLLLLLGRWAQTVLVPLLQARLVPPLGPLLLLLAPRMRACPRSCLRRPVWLGPPRPHCPGHSCRPPCRPRHRCRWRWCGGPHGTP
jgi:hypothetical protein